ncbi:MAG: serine/threonine protein kinase [Rhizobiales bacterium]|nr:serine/threonine protein kinase [Hyphomicrobiales bacterium]|tara:strand:+ start:1142 stop:1609 length:468 start_codon:yes stop_codon:yes gene_type:complete
MPDPALILAEGTAVHATAVVIGEQAFLFTGPSGAGKTTTALRCLSSAKLAGLNAALIADDGVILDCTGGRAVARCPASIAGLAEIRGSGIYGFPWRAAAVLTAVVAPAEPAGETRLPAEGEICRVGALELRLLRIDYRSPLDPRSVLEAAHRPAP